jgi:hypothetical protein
MQKRKGGNPNHKQARKRRKRSKTPCKWEYGKDGHKIGEKRVKLGKASMMYDV